VAARDIFLGSLLLECAMRTETNLEANQTNRTTKSESGPSRLVRIAGIAVRTLFLIVLTLITARVASPQMEHLTSIYETPGDLIRVLMGVGICSWFIVNLFILPKDPGAYRTWMYLGIAILPLSVLCAVVIW
jgi:hypothetical protein